MLVDNFSSHPQSVMTDKYSVLYEKIINDQQPDPTYSIAAFKPRRSATSFLSRKSNNSFINTASSSIAFRQNTGSLKTINDSCQSQACKSKLKRLEKEVEKLTKVNEILKKQSSNNQDIYKSYSEDEDKRQYINSAEVLLTEVDNIIKQLELFP